MDVKFARCHSGGALGADITWELECAKYGITTIAYSFKNHSQKSNNAYILSEEELNEGFQYVKIASKTIRKSIYKMTSYTKNLLSRNWFQIKNSNGIYAVGKFVCDNKFSLVDGGTGWTVQMAKDAGKTENLFLFDQISNKWFKCDSTSHIFYEWNDPVILTEQFAGIGTRRIDTNGIVAIQNILKYNVR